MSLNGYFVTGTDTGIGKTVLSCALIRALREGGHTVTPRKPVESGCEVRDGQLFPADGTALREAAGSPFPNLDRVTPYRFSHALAPDRAARLVGASLDIEQLRQACLADADQDALLVVEGAGGFYSPLAEDGLNADLAETLRLPVVLVAPDRLGTMNHVLLTAEAIARRGLRLALVVLNEVETEQPEGMDNRSDLARHLDCPILGFPRVKRTGDGWEILAGWLRDGA